MVKPCIKARKAKIRYARAYTAGSTKSDKSRNVAKRAIAFNNCPNTAQNILAGLPLVTGPNAANLELTFLSKGGIQCSRTSVELA